MDKIYIGKVIGTHGIKGEIKILSDVEVSDKAFKSGNILYFEDESNEYIIDSVRVHKGAYLVLKKKKVYIDRSAVLTNSEYVLEELLDFTVCDENNNNLGIIKDYEFNGSYATFLVEGDKKFYLPNVENYVTKIDLENKKVYTKNVGDLML